MGIAENGSLYHPMVIGHHAVLVGLAFTTDASGDPTLTTGSLGGQYDHATVSKSATNTYRITIDGGWGKTGSVQVRADGATAEPDVTEDASSGRVTIVMPAAFASKRCDVTMVIYSAHDVG